MARTPRLALSLLAILVALTLGAPPAHAEQASVRDPSGDASGPLDITEVTFDNGPSRIVVTVSFETVTRGNLAVSIEPRGGHGLTLGTFHRPGKPARTFAVSGSFDEGLGAKVPCQGLTSTWNHRKATVRVTLPARCLAHGEYGDLRFILLSEDNHGGDSDYAPQHGGRYHASRWIARG